MLNNNIQALRESRKHLSSRLTYKSATNIESSTVETDDDNLSSEVFTDTRLYRIYV